MKLLKEPLLRFLIAGGLLFASYSWLHRVTPRREDLRRIEITDEDVARMDSAWRAQWQRPPTPDELRGGMEEQVKEEILYREALALGLEKGDTVFLSNGSDTGTGRRGNTVSSRRR